MGTRRKGRECALQILYQAEVSRRDIEVSTELFWADHEKTDATVKDFCRILTHGIHKNLTVIDEKISKYANNWQLKRMAVIDKNILRMGVFELLFALDIPPKVTINEAIELAKRYGDLDSSKFVNGILDKVHKTEASSKTDAEGPEP